MLRGLRAALALAFLLAVPPVVLSAVADPLRPPVTAQPQVLGVILRGSSLPVELVLYAAGLVAWGLWGYLAMTAVLRLLLALPLARGRLWARARAVSDAVTLPFVRRLADGLVAAFLVVQAVRPFPAHAMPGPTLSPAVVMEVAGAQEPEQPHLETADSILYWVQPGDSLGLIARRIYGDSEQWPRLLEANRGVPPADGGALTDEAVIRRGWVFRAPLPAERVRITSSGSIQYTVSRGDSLSGIARRLLVVADAFAEPKDGQAGGVLIVDAGVGAQLGADQRAHLVEHPGAAARSYHRALALDPINEEVATNLARVLHQLGDRSGLMRLRASLTDALRRELDDPKAEPQPETTGVFGAALADLDTRSAESASASRRA